ncbi:MAG: LPXTG cell wall anchor domain-containing protein [Streptococcaceae bacterium]|nr:LPXTG cell wall anchor domain-containing protein [Streptococcaceae bacterium]
MKIKLYYVLVLVSLLGFTLALSHPKSTLADQTGAKITLKEATKSSNNNPSPSGDNIVNRLEDLLPKTGERGYWVSLTLLGEIIILFAFFIWFLIVKRRKKKEVEEIETEKRISAFE